VRVAPVSEDQWTIVGWLWQSFRHDLATVVNGFPYADGRYAHGELDGYPGPGKAGYLAWAPHPNLGQDAPIGFALVDDTDADVHFLTAFFVVPTVRRTGVGQGFAVDVIGRHPGGWRIGFQHDNVAAGAFWRAVAAEAFGKHWTETQVPVPGKPAVPPDHWIATD
jgi:predicted acetyltransferase